MIKQRGSPSQTWRTFLCNHADAIAAIDLCLVPTLTFECLFAFLVVSHDRPASMVRGNQASDGGVAGTTARGSIPMEHYTELSEPRHSQWGPTSLQQNVEKDGEKRQPNRTTPARTDTRTPTTVT